MVAIWGWLGHGRWREPRRRCGRRPRGAAMARGAVEAALGLPLLAEALRAISLANLTAREARTAKWQVVESDFAHHRRRALRQERPADVERRQRGCWRWQGCRANL